MKKKKPTAKITGAITGQKAVKATGNIPVWPYPNIVTMSWKAAQSRWRWTYKGKDYYFKGTPDEALTQWQERSPAIYNPDTADRRAPGLLTVEALVNHWLADQRARAEMGTISPKTLIGYEHTADRLAEYLGEKRTVSSLGPQDFARVLSKYDVGLYRRRDFIVISRSVFRWAVHKAHILDREPAYGASFEPPSDKQFRVHRAKIGSRDFTAPEVLRVLKTARRSPEWSAMAWLSINSAMSHADMAELPWASINGNELRWYRAKTAFRRVCWLWPETVRALSRLEHKPGSDLVFPDIEPARVVHGWRVVLDLAGISRDHSQYDFRRTFITVASASPDTEARKLAVGHRLPNVDDIYIQRFPINRVRAIARVVRAWLLSGRDNQAPAQASDGPDSAPPAPAQPSAT